MEIIEIKITPFTFISNGFYTAYRAINSLTTHLLLYLWCCKRINTGLVKWSFHLHNLLHWVRIPDHTKLLWVLNSYSSHYGSPEGGGRFVRAICEIFSQLYFMMSAKQHLKTLVASGAQRLAGSAT